MAFITGHFSSLQEKLFYWMSYIEDDYSSRDLSESEEYSNTEQPLDSDSGEYSDELSYLSSSEDELSYLSSSEDDKYGEEHDLDLGTPTQLSGRPERSTESAPLDIQPVRRRISALRRETLGKPRTGKLKKRPKETYQEYEGESSYTKKLSTKPQRRDLADLTRAKPETKLRPRKMNVGAKRTKRSATRKKRIFGDVQDVKLRHNLAFLTEVEREIVQHLVNKFFAQDKLRADSELEDLHIFTTAAVAITLWYCREIPLETYGSTVEKWATRLYKLYTREH
jgi:hypothetical protein